MTAANKPIDPDDTLPVPQGPGPSAANCPSRSKGQFGTRNGSFDPLPATDRGNEPIDPLYAAHTAEHILSAVMRREYRSPRVLETHLGAKKSKCDYSVRRPLSEDDVRRIEAAVNAEIEADHPVSESLVSIDKARGRFDLSKVPDAEERIRIVAIGDLDQTPCSGPHVERTSQVGRFEIRSADMRSEERIRIRFRLHDRAKGAA